MERGGTVRRRSKMETEFDVFVVGGGPAGLAAAIAARKAGLEVVVADGFEPPIDKACGEGLLPATLQALKRLDVRLGSCDGYPFYGIRFADHQSAVEAYFPGLRALGVRRTTLHARMLETAQNCGVRCRWRQLARAQLDRSKPLLLLSAALRISATLSSPSMVRLCRGLLGRPCPDLRHASQRLRNLPRLCLFEPFYSRRGRAFRLS